MEGIPVKRFLLPIGIVSLLSGCLNYPYFSDSDGYGHEGGYEGGHEGGDD